MAVDWDGLNTACMAAFGNEPGKGGTAITYLPQGARPFAIQAVFDRSYLDVLPLGGAGGAEARPMGAAGNVSARKPVLGIQLSQFPAQPRQGDQVSVGEEIFHVKEVRPDGHGWALLHLSKTRP